MTVCDEIADLTAEAAAVLKFLRCEEKHMTYDTTFDVVRKEGKIFDYLKSPKRAHILLKNICYCVSRRNFALSLLLDAAAKNGQNVLVLAIAGAV